MKESYVYFAANSEAVKIGFSTQPYIRQLQLHPQTRKIWMIGVTPGTIDDERALHRKFNHLWIPLYGEREWFRAVPEIAQFIDALEAVGELVPWFLYQHRWERRHNYHPHHRRLSALLLRGAFP